MNEACRICKGACCESVVVTLQPGDVGRWLGYHGTPTGGGRLELESPCRKLCGGSCSIWENRPDVCRVYEVGGAACRETVIRRRANAEDIFAAMPLTLGQ